MKTNQNQETEFGERMSVEQFLERTRSKNLDVYPRANKPGYYYFATESTLGYVPRELGKKLEEGKKINDLFVTEVRTPGYQEPMYMLCESRRESLLHFSVD